MSGQPADAPTTDVLGFKVLPITAPRVRRVSQLLIGLVFFGIALGCAIQATFGTNPWVVFAQGLAEKTGLSVGVLTVLIGASLLVFLWLLHEPLGLGTVLNVLLIGPVIDATTWALPDSESVIYRLILILISPALLGLASGLYLGAGLGPGPRDGLMTAFGRRGLPIWFARTLIEIAALAIGWVLGGDVGWGTLWIAVSIGPWVQLFLGPLTIDQPAAAR